MILPLKLVFTDLGYKSGSWMLGAPRFVFCVYLKSYEGRIAKPEIVGRHVLLARLTAGIIGFTQ